jgi:hypothetical protein
VPFSITTVEFLFRAAIPRSMINATPKTQNKEGKKEPGTLFDFTLICQLLKTNAVKTLTRYAALWPPIFAAT